MPGSRIATFALADHTLVVVQESTLLKAAPQILTKVQRSTVLIKFGQLIGSSHTLVELSVAP